MSFIVHRIRKFYEAPCYYLLSKMLYHLEIELWNKVGWLVGCGLTSYSAILQLHVYNYTDRNFRFITL